MKSDIVTIILQLIIALGIINVWILRYGKTSPWRGGNAQNMKEEFAVYGLPPWFVTVIGALKLGLAVALLGGIWFPELVRPAAYGIAVLMIGAVGMHLKVRDPLKKSLPALVLLFCSLWLIWF